MQTYQKGMLVSTWKWWSTNSIAPANLHYLPTQVTRWLHESAGPLPCPGRWPIRYLPACWRASRRWPSLGHWASLPGHLWAPLCPPRSRSAVPKEQRRTPMNNLRPACWLYIPWSALLTVTGECWTAAKPTVDAPCSAEKWEWLQNKTKQGAPRCDCALRGFLGTYAIAAVLSQSSCASWVAGPLPDAAVLAACCVQGREVPSEKTWGGDRGGDDEGEF